LNACARPRRSTAPRIAGAPTCLRPRLGLVEVLSGFLVPAGVRERQSQRLVQPELVGAIQRLLQISDRRVSPAQFNSGDRRIVTGVDVRRVQPDGGLEMPAGER